MASLLRVPPKFMNEFLIDTIGLFKDLVVSPRKAFNTITREEANFEVCIIFCLGSIPPLIKTLFIDSVRIVFFDSSTLDAILNMINNPQIVWALHFCSFFAYVILIGFLCRIFLGESRTKRLLLCFMAISGVGIIMQIGFIFLRFIMPADFYIYYSYLAFLWCCFLAVMAIRYSQNSSIKASVLLFLLPSMPFLIIFGSGGLFPSLAWLTV